MGKTTYNFICLKALNQKIILLLLYIAKGLGNFKFKNKSAKSFYYKWANILYSLSYIRFQQCLFMMNYKLPVRHGKVNLIITTTINPRPRHRYPRQPLRKNLSLWTYDDQSVKPGMSLLLNEFYVKKVSPVTFSEVPMSGVRLSRSITSECLDRGVGYSREVCQRPRL